MSLVLVSPTTIRLARIFEHLTEGELVQLRNIVELMDKEVFTPVIESPYIEKTIEENLYRYSLYLTQALIPIYPKLVDMCKRPEAVIDLYNFLRGEIRKKVSDRYSSRLILSALNVAEEHDGYLVKLLSNTRKFMTIVGKAGAQAYLRTFAKTSLAMIVVFLAIDRKPRTVKELSRIVKKYADELDPFVAAFQVFLEPELARLREKTSESKMEKAKELRGSLFDILEN